MYLTFLKDYAKDGVLIYKKDGTNLVLNDMLARYLIRKGFAVESR